MLHSLCLAILILIAATDHAYAYIDPGTGSILLQSLVAFIAAGSVAVGHYWQRIKSFFKPESDIAESAEEQAKDRG